MDTTNTQAPEATTIRWTMDSYSSESFPGQGAYEGATYSATLPQAATPPAMHALIARMEAAGYVYQAGAGIKAFMTHAKHNGAPTVITYRIGTAAVFERDGARLAYRVSSPAGHATLAEAIATAQPQPAPVAWATAGPIPTGKGQITAATAEANRIRQALAAELEPDSEVVIAITALAGRYGWKAKTAHRRYKVSEIDAPPAKPAALPAVMCSIEIWSIFTKQYRAYGRAKISVSSRSPKAPGSLGTVEIRRRPYDVTTVSPRTGEASADWIYIGENYRIAAADWARLQQRQQPAQQAQEMRIAA